MSHVGYGQLSSDSDLPTDVRRQALAGILGAQARALSLLRGRVFTDDEARRMDAAQSGDTAGPAHDDRANDGRVTMPVDHQALSERYARALASGDYKVIDEVFTEDFVDEYPQSGEVIRGRDNLRAMMEHRPGLTPDTGPDLASVRAKASDEHRVLAPLFTRRPRPGSWRRRHDVAEVPLPGRILVVDDRRLRAARRSDRSIDELLRAPVRGSRVASPVRGAASGRGRLSSRSGITREGRTWTTSNATRRSSGPTGTR